MSSLAFVLCDRLNPGLLGSYGRALRYLGWRTEHYDHDAGLRRHVRLGKLGELVSGHLGVESWNRKANRDLYLSIVESRPDVFVFAGPQLVRPGLLAQLRVALPDCRIVCYWPDTLLNLESHTIQLLALCDLVLSYSRAAVPVLERVGARRVLFSPFAADLELFPELPPMSVAEQQRWSSDVMFAANHRPEREEAVIRLVDAGMRVRVWGSSDWVRSSRHPDRVADYFEGSILGGSDMTRAMRGARACLNLIDPTNHPAANMRFFEIYASGGCALSSRCPEMEAEFIDGEHASYFDSDSLVDRARALCSDPVFRQRVAMQGRSKVVAAHTYSHRVGEWLEALD
jgi:hypothetical protein